MRGHAWPDTTTNIALRYNTNLAMLDKIWSCSARQFWCCRGAVTVLSCCRGAVGKWTVNDDADPTKSSRRALTRSAAVPIGKKQVILWDASVVGFGLRCYATGARTWIFVYRAPGGGRKAPSQTLTLGSWPTVSVEAARKAARGHAGAVANGRDPAAERREERRAEKATLRLALDDYERSLEQRRIVNVRTIMSALRRGLAALMRNDVRTLTRGHYVAAIAVIERGGGWGGGGPAQAQPDICRVVRRPRPCRLQSAGGPPPAAPQPRRTTGGRRVWPRLV